MNPQETGIRNRFIFVSIFLSVVVVIFVAFVFYKDLYRMHRFVYSEYEKVYIQNSNEQVKSVVDYFVDSIKFEHSKLLAEEREKLKKQVREACRMLLYFYSNLKGRIPESDIKSILLKALTIEGKSFTVVDESGRVLLSSYFAMGSNISNYTDARGNNLFSIVKEETNSSDRREAFVVFYARSNEFCGASRENGIHKMLLYAKYIPEFGWYVGDLLSYSRVEQRLKDSFKEQISHFRYGTGGEGYLFILRLIIRNGTIKVIRVVNPNKPSTSIGKEVPLDITDVAGKKFLREMIEIALHRGSGFVHYKFRVPGTKKIMDKTTYIRYYPEWGWIVASGYYPGMFYDKLKRQDVKLNKMFKRFILSLAFELFIFNVLLFLGLLYFVNRIMGSIVAYREKLENREKFQLHLIDFIPNPLFVLDDKGNFININRAFKRFFCVAKEEINGIEMNSEIKRVANEALKFVGKKEQGIVKLRLRSCENNERYVELHVSSFYDINGKVAGVIGILFDITLQQRIKEELAEMSIRDELTGLFNRRYFNRVLSMEIERAKRYGQKLSLILYDIDHFKRVNDTYGHQVGDSVLKELSQLVKSNLRNVDYVFRIGGEEFAIILAGTDLKGAVAVAEKLRKRVSEHEFQTVGKVTISLGVTAFNPHDTFESLLKRADDALYMAKRNGRNRVEVLEI